MGSIKPVNTNRWGSELMVSLWNKFSLGPVTSTVTSASTTLDLSHQPWTFFPVALNQRGPSTYELAMLWLTDSQLDDAWPSRLVHRCQQEAAVKQLRS